MFSYTHTCFVSPSKSPGLLVWVFLGTTFFSLFFWGCPDLKFKSRWKLYKTVGMFCTCCTTTKLNMSQLNSIQYCLMYIFVRVKQIHEWRKKVGKKKVKQIIWEEEQGGNLTDFHWLDRYEPLCPQQQWLQPPVPVPPTAQRPHLRLPHGAGTGQQWHNLHRPWGLPPLLLPVKHQPHLLGNQPLQPAHPHPRGEGGGGHRFWFKG